jgi:EamA domain-containing membrane protein RarD
VSFTTDFCASAISFFARILARDKAETLGWSAVGCWVLGVVRSSVATTSFSAVGIALTAFSSLEVSTLRISSFVLCTSGVLFTSAIE